MSQTAATATAFDWQTIGMLLVLVTNGITLAKFWNSGRQRSVEEERRLTRIEMTLDKNSEKLEDLGRDFERAFDLKERRK
jgi:hypothetical protein